jgi:NAD(P)-dependent dehydrogenase (short-subunit alcohol dehydrogenase family)
MSIVPNGKIVVVFGASRGLGKEIALSLGREGYVVGVAAKTTENSSAGVQAKYKLEGTIEQVVREIESFGGLALALPWDAVTASSETITSLFQQVSTRFPTPKFYPFAVVYNAGALSWLSVPQTDIKKLDLLWNVNARGSFTVVKEGLTWLRASEVAKQTTSDQKGWTPKIIVVSPPIYSRFFRGKIGYAMSKIPMTALVMGLPVDILRTYPESRITPVSLWPATSVQSAATAALENTTKNSPGSYLRIPAIWSDAVSHILRDDGKKDIEGRALIDEDYLRERWGFKDKDFVKYRLNPNIEPKRAVPKILPSLRVEEEDEELIDTRDLETMKQIFGRGTKPKL